MKKNIHLIVYTGLIMFLPFVLKGQGTAENYVDSLKQVLKKAPNDSVQYSTLHSMYSYYEEKQKDSALAIAQQMYKLSSRNHQRLSKIINLGMIGYQQLGLGDYSSSLKNLLQALEWSEESDQKTKSTWSIEAGTRGTVIPIGQEAKVVESQSNHLLGNLLLNTGNVQQAKTFFRKALSIARETGYQFRLGMGSMNLGRCFLIENNIDSALYLITVADSIAQISAASRYLANINTYLGDIAQKKGDQKKASQYYHVAIYNGIKSQNFNGLAQAYFAASRFFLVNNNHDSSIFYSNKCLEVIQTVGKSFSLINVNKGNVYQTIFESYRLANKKDSTAKYRVIALEQKDSINKVRIKTLIDFQQTLFENQLRLQKLEKDKIVGENRNRTKLFIAGILLVAIVGLLLYRNNRIKAKDNVVLQKTLNELKSTQAQLVQSEKMASLGELTAGIAHEIQNPLNFVNNFSEVSGDLVAEMNEEMSKAQDQLKGGQPDLAAQSFAYAVEIAQDLKMNLEKINHHGKRADGIVKGMLQHSRTGSGQKEPTNLVALCDEYLRLAYHGYKAKDNTFQAEFELKAPENLPLVPVVPQEMGRVILNLINNAFYAVNERAKTKEEGYKPKVVVSLEDLSLESKLAKGSTTRTNARGSAMVNILVRDNGNGIAPAVQEKIFQPFFTTKPTGQGTGLGLSLSYDIVKAHGGEIKLESETQKGSSFKIELPV